MRVFRKIMALALALTLTLSMGVVSVFAAEGAGASSITLDKATLELGTSGNVTGTVTATAVGASSITWTSSKEGIVKFSDETGSPDTGVTVTVTAVAAGTATITATAPGVSGGIVTATCEVTVTGGGGEPEVDADRIAVDAAKITVEAGTYTVAEATANTNVAVKTSVKGVITAMNLTGITAEATINNFTAASDGTDGSFDISVVLTKNGKTATATKIGCKITATATEVDKSNDNLITGFMISNSNSVINQVDHTIAVGVPHNTDVTKLIPTITISKKASVVPDSGVVQNFTKPVTYTVTAENGDIQKYVVTVTKWADPNADMNAVKAEADKIKSIAAPAKDATKLTLPTVGTGFTVDITYSSNSHVIALDGTITPPAKAETIALVLTVTYTDKDVSADTAPIKVTVPARSGGGNTDTGGSSGGSTGGSTGGNNTANTPATTDKVNNTVEALKDPTVALPKDVVKTTTAGGATINTIPVAMTSGSATVGSSLFETLGSAPATVGLKLTVSNGMYGGSMEVIIPGGFGKITEPGRFSFPMDYNATAENSSKMLTAVKGDKAVSMTAKVGGNFTLPVTATVTVPTKLANGSTVNIYKYDPLTNKMISIGKAVVKDGKLTFATKMMGEMLFTTGTV